MTQTFTQIDLMRHLYTEESEQESDKINFCLAADEQLNENFNDYRLILQELSASMLSPSTDSVNFIMEFSRITA